MSGSRSPESDPGLSITIVSTDQNCAVVALSGELDYTTARHVRKALTSLVDQGCHHIIVDMTAVPMCDSTGLAAFVDTYQHANQRGGTVRVVAAPPMVLRMFRVTGIDRFIRPFPTIQEASDAPR